MKDMELFCNPQCGCRNRFIHPLFTLNKSKIFADYLERSDFMITFAEKRWRMTFLNQFHKEATERSNNCMASCGKCF